MIAPRCHQRGDLAPTGWAACIKCHAYNDLGRAFCGDAGIDEYRLQRALAYIRGRRPVEPLESLLRKLTRRVAELEQAVPNMNGRLHQAECELDLR